jgi:hypothetical protein
VPSWLALKEVFNATGYWRIEEGRGRHLMRGNEEEEMRRLFPLAEVARGGHGVARGHPVAPALFPRGEGEGGQRGRVGQKAEWAGWLLVRLIGS